MPQYTVQDTTSGKQVTFEWTGDAPPTDSDMEEIFSQARTMTPKKKSSGVTGTWEEEKSALGSIPELAGGMVGGLVTAAKRSPVAMAAAGLGGAAGEAAKQLYQQATDSPNAPQTGMDAAKRIGMSGATQALGEGAGRLIGAGLTKMAAPFAKTFKGDIAEADDALKSAMGSKIGFTPAQKTDSHIVDVLENVAEQSFTGGGTMMNFRKLQQEGYSKITGSVLADFEKHAGGKATPEEVGLIFQNAKAAKNAVWKRLAGMKYNKVDQLAGGASVSLAPLKREAQVIMETAAKRKGIGSTTAKDSLLKKVLELDDTVTFKEAQAIRAGLMDEISTMSASSDVGKGIARKFVNITDKSMETSARSLSPDAYKAWREANSFYRTYKETFGNDFMRSLDKIAQNSPEKVVGKIFQNGSVTQIRNVKNIVSSKTFDTLKASYLKRIMEDSMKEEGVVVGKTLQGKLKTMGNPALKEIFTPYELGRINNVVNIGTQLQKRAGGGGGMLVQLMQASGLIGVATGAATGNAELAQSGAAVLFGPYVLSKMLTNPTTAKWLAQGFSTPAKSKQAAILGAKITAAAAKYQTEKQKEPIQYD